MEEQRRTLPKKFFEENVMETNEIVSTIILILAGLGILVTFVIFVMAARMNTKNPFGTTDHSVVKGKQALTIVGLLALLLTVICCGVGMFVSTL